MTAVLVGLVLAFGIFSDNGLGDPMIKRPLVMSALTGLVLGDLEAGVRMGAALELVFLGVVGIGGTLPSDSLTGSVLGTAFAIITNSGSEVALALAVPIGLLAVFVRNTYQIGISYCMPMVDRWIDEGKDKNLVAFHYIAILGMCILHFVVGYLGIALGSDIIQNVVNAIPASIMDALTAISMILPALGIALLMNMLWDKKIAIFLLLGFVLVGYFDLPLIAVAIIGTLIAVVMAMSDLEARKNKTVTTAASGPALTEEEFFND